MTFTKGQGHRKYENASQNWIKTIVLNETLLLLLEHHKQHQNCKMSLLLRSYQCSNDYLIMQDHHHLPPSNTILLPTFITHTTEGKVCICTWKWQFTLNDTKVYAHYILYTFPWPSFHLCMTLTIEPYSCSLNS